MKLDLQKLNSKYPKAYLDFATGCAEPGYDNKPVILANWNNVPDKVYTSLEKSGYLCEWSDEWIACDECCKVFRSSPDSYSWGMFGHVFDGYAVCGDCIKDDPDDYLEDLTNNPRRAITCSILRVLDLPELGYEQIATDFENGFYPGQNDNPENILKSAREKYGHDHRFIFAIDSQGQFDIGFSLWHKLPELEDDTN